MVGCNLTPTTLLVYDWSNWQNKVGTNPHCPLMFRRTCNGIWSEQATVDYHNTTPQKFNNPIYNFLFSVQRLGHQNLHLWIHNLHHFLVTGHYNILLFSVCHFLYCVILSTYLKRYSKRNVQPQFTAYTMNQNVVYSNTKGLHMLQNFVVVLFDLH